MADDVEGQGAGPSNDQELTQVVHGSHDTRCAYAPEDIGGHSRKIRKSVEKWDKGNKQADRNGCLVEQKLRRRYGKVLNLLANPDLVQGSTAESQGCDNDTKQLGLGRFVDGEGNSNACCKNSGQHVSRNVLSEKDKVDENDRGCGHNLGKLVEANRVEGQAKVAKNNIASEEAADG